MGYQEPPWTFDGRALFQLQLVKVSEARKYIPESLPLVSLFGYTLGGVYLARYSDSPVGPFDELVAMAGLVWNWPLSCAWAARVYVNDKAARDHGLDSVGLPSKLASFCQDTSAHLPGRRSWWTRPAKRNMQTRATIQEAPTKSNDEAKPLFDHPLAIRCAEGSAWWRLSPRQKGIPREGFMFARLTLPAAPTAWPGPRMKIWLPSFSGATEACPQILKYTCQLSTRCSVCGPIVIEVEDDDDDPEALGPLLKGRPLITFNFADMEMKVREPQVVRRKHPVRIHPRGKPLNLPPVSPA